MRRGPANICANADCTNLHIRDFGPKPGFMRYLVREYLIPPNGTSLALQFPERFTGALPPNVHEAYELSFSVWPGLTGIEDSQNKDRAACAALCGGRMEAHIYYSVSHSRSADTALSIFLGSPPTAGERLTRLAAPAGYDFAIDLSRPDIPYDDSTFYYRKAAPNQPALSAVCTDRTPVQLCNGRTDSDQYAGLQIEVVFDRSLIADWPTLSSRLRDLLDRSVVGRTP